ncbi:hypothetical protein ACFL54_04610 [Planctomycetota bacterium]
MEYLDTVIFICLGLYVLYIQSYIKKKGKNLATKEDIAEITRISEGIKSSFSLFADNKNRLSENEYKAIVEFYEDSTNLLMNFVYFDIMNYDLEDDEKDIKARCKILLDMILKMSMSFSKIILYSGVNTEINNAATKINICLIKLLNKFAVEVDSTLMTYDFLMNISLRYEKELQELGMGCGKYLFACNEYFKKQGNTISLEEDKTILPLRKKLNKLPD